MYRILTASKDTYITNKIINNSFRATDANVGDAGTIDLFKLYNESTLTGTTNPIELSRGLIKFDLTPLRALTSSNLDITDSSFKCTLKLHDVYGGQTTPSNFNLVVFPLSRSFDEGIGRDVVSFDDLDAANFITASVSGDTVVAWNMTGANRQGVLDSDNLDIIASGTIPGKGSDGVVDLWKSQTFTKGTEDLSIDITTIISATLKNLLPDHGLRISYSSTQETDTKTRFIKRFFSRHTSKTSKRPKLIVQYDDTVFDHHRSFFFNISGSLFLNNFHRGQPKNILTGTAGSMWGISGSDCLILTLTSGVLASGTYYSKIITASQHKIGNNFITGVYSASFAISQWATGALTNEIKNAGSATLTEVWGSKDGTVGYFTSSFITNSVNRTSFNNVPKRLFVNVTNLKDTYKSNEKATFRVFIEDFGRDIKAKKLPLETKSEIFTKVFYRIRDYDSNEIIVPFETTSNATRLSTDTDGMYFDLYMSTLPVGRAYVFDFLVDDQNLNQIFSDVPAKFRVE